MKNICVYVAGKYSANNVMDVLENIRVGTKKCAELLKKGFVPFCPWLDYQFKFYEPSLKLEDYYRYSIAWLERSDIVYVLPNYEKSKGTLKEIKRAQELGIPVIFSDSVLDYYCVAFKRCYR